jgi:hypothetical protein
VSYHETHMLCHPSNPNPKLTAPDLKLTPPVTVSQEHGVSYHETDMWVGTKEVLSHLHEVTRDFLAEFPAM